MSHEDQVLRDLVALFGSRITAVEVERTMRDGAAIKIRLELLSLKDITHAYVDDRGFAYGACEGDPDALREARERSRAAGLS